MDQFAPSGDNARHDVIGTGTGRPGHGGCLGGGGGGGGV